MLENFDPNGPGINNGNFIGLPFEESNAELILFPVPWDVTVSYSAGTSGGPENIRQASTQLDLMHPLFPEAWKKGIFFQAENNYWRRRNEELRPLAEQYIQFLEEGGDVSQNKKMQRILEEINYSCENLNNWVETETSRLVRAGKKIALIGGEHSIPLGYYKALAKQFGDFGILQIDAHMDLRAAYEGFTYSHASIFYNALKLEAITQLTQVGIRDYCEEEVQFAESESERIKVFYDHFLQEKQFIGTSWNELCEKIIDTLPQKVHVSFDIDGLEPSLCPNTGTPVPGGLSFPKAAYLLNQLKESGREIIGFDVCEVAGAPHEWDANVGARLIYHLSALILGGHK